MKKVLVLGAGHSAPYLIYKLLDMSEALDMFVTVGDIDEALARSRIGDHPRGDAIRFDVNDEVHRGERFGMIRFGSRVDIFLSPGVVVKVKRGDRVKAGLSVIGEIQ